MIEEFTFRLVLVQPPPDVDFGVQIGRGTSYRTAQTQRSTGRDLRFEFAVGLSHTGQSSAPDFRGPVVQGVAGQRFVYVDIGTYAGQTDTAWSRRLKVPLTGISSAMLTRARLKGLVFETRVPGTGKDGGPACATVQSFAGWTLAPP